MAADQPPDRIPPHAWRRFRTIMAWVSVTGGAAALGILYALDRWAGPLPIVAMIVVAVGVLMTMMLGGALMSLLFLSHGTGHDDRAADPFKDME